MSRYPVKGDTLVVSCPQSHQRHIGLVTNTERDHWGHQKYVFVCWQSEPPWDYSKKYGYSGVNIHNLRHIFRIFRNGLEIR